MLFLIIAIVLIVGVPIIYFLVTVYLRGSEYHGEYFRSAEERGEIGENCVKAVIGETIEGVQYVINDLFLERKGKSSQIDHIVINPRGVFVIETKNYSGVIYGSENQQEWTQVLSYGRSKNKIYNPLKQNATHIYNVKHIVGEIPVFSLVVLVQNNTFNIDAYNVIPLSALKTELQQGKNVLSAEEMKIAYDRLMFCQSNITKEEHINNIREQQRDLEHGICPRCGGRLTLRSGKYGDFFGCSNYPNCKFIKKR